MPGEKSDFGSDGIHADLGSKSLSAEDFSGTLDNDAIISFSIYWTRAASETWKSSNPMLLKFQCAYETLKDLVKTHLLIQEVLS